MPCEITRYSSSQELCWHFEVLLRFAENTQGTGIERSHSWDTAFIIKDTDRAIEHLRKTESLAIILVEQYLDYCRRLASETIIMDRGRVVSRSSGSGLES